MKNLLLPILVVLALLVVPEVVAAQVTSTTIDNSAATISAHSDVADTINFYSDLPIVFSSNNMAVGANSSVTAGFQFTTVADAGLHSGNIYVLGSYGSAIVPLSAVVPNITNISLPSTLTVKTDELKGSLLLNGTNFGNYPTPISLNGTMFNFINTTVKKGDFSVSIPYQLQPALNSSNLSIYTPIGKQSVNITFVFVDEISPNFNYTISPTMPEATMPISIVVNATDNVDVTLVKVTAVGSFESKSFELSKASDGLWKGSLNFSTPDTYHFYISARDDSDNVMTQETSLIVSMLSSDVTSPNFITFSSSKYGVVVARTFLSLGQQTSINFTLSSLSITTQETNLTAYVKLRTIGGDYNLSVGEPIVLSNLLPGDSQLLFYSDGPAAFKGQLLIKGPSYLNISSSVGFQGTFRNISIPEPYSARLGNNAMLVCSASEDAGLIKPVCVINYDSVASMENTSFSELVVPVTPSFLTSQQLELQRISNNYVIDTTELADQRDVALAVMFIFAVLTLIPTRILPNLRGRKT